MDSQQPPGESKTINISTNKCANGFTTASWRIQNHLYFNKQICKWLRNSLLENPKPLIFKQKMCKWLHSNLLENPKLLIFKKKCANGCTTAALRIQNQKYFSKKMFKWLHNNLLENPKTINISKTNLQMVSQQPPGESKTINI